MKINTFPRTSAKEHAIWRSRFAVVVLAVAVTVGCGGRSDAGTVATNSAKAITAFSFLSANNPGLSADVVATMNGTSINATVPFGTPVSALRATFSTTGASVAVGSTTQVSGGTANDFSGPVTYHVTAADSSTQSYTVTVTIALSSSKAITAFSFLSVNNSGLSADVTATINGTSIDATVPFGTAVAALKATFSTTGMAVTVGGTPQVSSVTANDFSSPITLRAQWREFVGLVARALSRSAEGKSTA